MHLRAFVILLIQRPINNVRGFYPNTTNLAVYKNDQTHIFKIIPQFRHGAMIPKIEAI